MFWRATPGLRFLIKKCISTLEFLLENVPANNKTVNILAAPPLLPLPWGISKLLQKQQQGNRKEINSSPRPVSYKVVSYIKNFNQLNENSLTCFPRSIQVDEHPLSMCEKQSWKM